MAYDSVKWSFLEELVVRKDFDQQVNSWIMSTVTDGSVCINVNGENEPYFKTHRRLRQGDPGPYLRYCLTWLGML